MSKRSDYITEMEARLDGWAARVATLSAGTAVAPDAQVLAAWKAQCNRARTLLTELRDTHGFVWELRRDVIETAWRDLDAVLTA